MAQKAAKAVDVAPANQPQAKVIPKTAISSFSINGLMKKNETNDSVVADKDNNSVRVVDEPNVELNTPVKPESLLVAIKKYAAQIEKDNMRLFSILSNQEPQIENGSFVKLKLSNTIQETELSKEKPAILSFLRRELKNSSLDLIWSVVEDDESQPKKVFTAADKFREMMQKNPALSMLKQQFNLDLD